MVVTLLLNTKTLLNRILKYVKNSSCKFQLLSTEIIATYL